MIIYHYTILKFILIRCIFFIIRFYHSYHPIVIFHRQFTYIRVHISSNFESFLNCFPLELLHGCGDVLLGVVLLSSFEVLSRTPINLPITVLHNSKVLQFFFVRINLINHVPSIQHCHSHFLHLSTHFTLFHTLHRLHLILILFIFHSSSKYICFHFRNNTTMFHVLFETGLFFFSKKLVCFFFIKLRTDYRVDFTEKYVSINKILTISAPPVSDNGVYFYDSRLRHKKTRIAGTALDTH